MSKGLSYQGQIDVPCDQVGREGMLEDMRMPLFSRQTSGRSNRLEVTKELASAEFSPLLAREQVIRAVRRPLAEPGPHCIRFVEQWLTAVLVQWLHCLERTLQTPDEDRTGFQVNIG